MIATSDAVGALGVLIGIVIAVVSAGLLNPRFHVGRVIPFGSLFVRMAGLAVVLLGVVAVLR